MQIRIRETPVNIDWSASPVQWGPSDLQNRITTASFVYESLQNPTVTFVPREGDDVRIVDDSGTVTFFLGHIAQITRGGGPIGRQYAIVCQDLNYLFNKIRLPADQVLGLGFSDAVHVDNVLTGVNFYPDLTYFQPQGAIGFTLSVVPKVQGLQGITLKAGLSITDALNQISTAAGGVAWYLDSSNRTFHWNDTGMVAPLVLTTSPDKWPNAAAYFYNYSEFIDRTTHFEYITVDNGAGISATVHDWPSFGDTKRVKDREFGGANPAVAPVFPRYLEGARVTDTSLTTQAQVTQRAYLELQKGRTRRTINLTYDRATTTQAAPIQIGMLVDLVHGVWDAADVTPVPHISREVGTHSNVRGEMVPGSRGRFLVQKVTPRIKAKGSPTLYSYDLVLGDYEDSLAATLAGVV